MITLQEQIACIKRELALRRRVYPRRIQAGRMTAAQAESELARMEAVLQSLRRIAEAQHAQDAQGRLWIKETLRRTGMRQDHIIVDVEIQRTIEETPGGWEATDRLGVACAVVYEYRTNRYRIYGDTADDLERLRKRILQADRISGYNIWAFDFPVIWSSPKAMWLQYSRRGASDPDAPAELRHCWRCGNDLLRRIWQAQGLDPDTYAQESHGGWGLDAVCRQLFRRGKIDHGAHAPHLYQAGRWGELLNYCLDDVQLTKMLVDFVDHYGYIVSPKTGAQVFLQEEAP